MFYDLEIDLSKTGSIGRDVLKHGMRVRVFGQRSTALLQLPPVEADFYLKNDGQDSVVLRRGAKSITVSPKAVNHIWLDGTPSGMVNVS